jgi:hypothetical protein
MDEDGHVAIESFNFMVIGCALLDELISHLWCEYSPIISSILLSNVKVSYRNQSSSMLGRASFTMVD